jgi:hypothetical protein
VKNLKRHLNVANVLSAMALFVALSGVTYAATAAKNSVKTKSIAKQAVTTPQLKTNAVTSAKIRKGAVTSSKIGASAVGGTQIADGSVRAVELGGGVVTTAKLQNGAVADAKLANNAVTTNKINTEAVTTGKLGNESVTGAKLSASILGQLVKNVSYVTAKSVKDKTAEAKGTTAVCPTGKQAIGGGARILTGAGEEADTVAMTQSAPIFDGAGKATGWFAQARPIGAPGTVEWEIEVHAVCAEL